MPFSSWEENLELVARRCRLLRCRRLLYRRLTSSSRGRSRRRLVSTGAQEDRDQN